MNTNTRPDSRKEPPRTPPTRRRSVDAKESFKEELVRIARHLFETEGSAAVSMRAIAHQAGVSPMAVYRYFPNKMTLLSHLWDSVFVELAQALETQLNSAQPLHEQAIAALDIYIDFWLARPDHFRMIYVEPALHPQAHAELSFWSDSHGLARLRHLLAQHLERRSAEQATDEASHTLSAVAEQLTIYLAGLMHTLIGRVESPWLNHQRARENAKCVTLQILGLAGASGEKRTMGA